MKKRNTVKVLIILLMLSACVFLVYEFFIRSPVMPPTPPPEREVTEDTENIENVDEDQVNSAGAVIFAVSDYQADPNFDTPEETLRGLFDAVESDGIRPDAALFCGDFTNDELLHDYQLSPEDSIAEIREVVRDKAPSVNEENLIFVQGNHDRLTESISESGLHEFDDYLVYVLNTENDFPWKQGKTSGCLLKVTRAASEMKECFDRLIADGETRPVIIAAHVPLHFTARTSSRHTTGDNLYSSLIFDVLNKASADLDIIFLFGHDHSKGWDCYLGGSCVYREPGDTILVPVFEKSDVNTDDYEERTLNFTYMNAGYTGYYMNCAPAEYSSSPDSQYRAADETLTGSVIEISADTIVISRYDVNGRHALGSAGEANPYKGGIDEGLIGPEYYSRPVTGSKVIIRRHSKEQELEDAA